MKTLLKFDLHVHAMLSKSIPFKMHDLNLMIKQARELGLSGFALVEHIHAPTYWDTYRTLREQFEYGSGIFHIEPDFCLFNGAEINLSSDGHIVVLGEMEAIKDLDSKLDLNKGNRPTISELLKESSDELLLIGAHPFRPNGGVTKSAPSLVKQLCALELNGKDFELEDKVRKAARKLNMPLIGGSDAHLWPQLGLSATTLPYCEVSIPNLKHLISNGYAEAAINKDNAFVVDMCSQHKRRMKVLEKDTQRRGGRKRNWSFDALRRNAAIQLSLI